MRHLCVLALATLATVVAADEGSIATLPNLELERGESLVYAFPPHESYALSDPRVVRVVAGRGGVLELVGTVVGSADLKLVSSRDGKPVVYLSRIEVALPFEDAIAFDVRAAHQAHSAVEQTNAATERLGRARELYRTRAQHDENLALSYVSAREAWCLLDRDGPKTTLSLEAEQLMSTSQAELDTRCREVANEADRAIRARDWRAVETRLALLLRIVPDRRDVRHRRAQSLRAFYADMLTAAENGPDAGGRDEEAAAVRMEQFRSAVQLAVGEMKKSNFKDAATHLATADSLEKSQSVKLLLRLNDALADRPTDHIDLILELSSTLGKLTNDVWIKTGVVELARVTYERWSRERDNAKHASRGDEHFDNGRYREALDCYDQIDRDSEFSVVRLGKIGTCRTKLAEGLRDAAKAALRGADPEGAIAQIKAAMAIAPPDMHNELINLQMFAQNNSKYAAALRKGREEAKAGRSDAATQLLEQIPDSSIYFKDAAEALEALHHDTAKRESAKLFQLGFGEKVVAMLRAATDPNLVAFREKVDSVHQVYLQAKALHEAERYAQANELWDTLKRMVGDPTNQYFKWADAGLTVDPKALAQTFAKAAEDLYTAGELLEAAKLNTRALKYDAKNVGAVKLRATIERQVNLRYSIERQKWESNTIDNAAFLAFATEQYVVLRAASPIHPLLAMMAAHIAKTGGKVPPEEPEPGAGAR